MEKKEEEEEEEKGKKEETVVGIWCTVLLTVVPSRAREWLSPVTPVKVKAADVTCGGAWVWSASGQGLGRHPLTADGRCPGHTPVGVGAEKAASLPLWLLSALVVVVVILNETKCSS